MGASRANELGRWLVLLIWIGVNGVLFGVAYKQFDSGKEYYYLKKILKGSLPWARASAAVLNFNCLLILLPVCRNLLSLLRGFHCCGLATNIIRLLDKHLTFHRHVAYAICVFTAIHIGAHVFNFERFIEAWEAEDDSLPRQLSLFEDTQSTTWLNPIRKHKADPTTELFQTVAGISGVVMTLALIVMYTSSTELLRRSYFEVFWYTHHFFIIFFAGLVVHGFGTISPLMKPPSLDELKQGLVRKQVNLDEHDPEECKGVVQPAIGCEQPRFEATGAMTWKWVAGPMFLYFIERCIRFFRSLQNVKVTKVIQHPSNVLEIRMKKSGFHSLPGQYIFLHCPKISQLEWHPFTLTSCQDEDYFSVHIRIVGDWTTALAKSFLDENEQERQQTPRLAVDGPFGTSSTDFLKYTVCVFVGAGIGVTPFASILKAIWYQHNKSESSLNIKKIYFFWICPDTKAFEWFAELLESLEVQLSETGNADFLEYNIYLTRGWTNNEARNIMIRDRQEGEDVITGLKQKTYFGKPQWDGIFNKIAESNPRSDIGVFFCGPPSLSHTLHTMSNQHSNVKEGLKFYYNKENF